MAVEKKTSVSGLGEHVAVDQRLLCCREAAPTPSQISPGRGLLLRTFVANYWYRYAAHKKLVAKVAVAFQGILLQAYVVEWLSKPVTCL